MTMSFFNQQIERVQAQLTNLPAGRKLLWGCLLAAVIAGGVLWGRMPRSVAWEPVLDQPLDSSELTQITTYLSGAGVPFRNNGAKVLVPSDRKMQVLADLLYQDLLPSNTESGFDAIAKTSIWDSSAKIDHLYTRAKEIALQNVIGRFPGVRKATVLIDPTSEQHINGSVTPSALVDIQTRGDVRNTHRLAVAAANAVTGAQSNLARNKVQVTIDGAPVQTTLDPSELASDERLERTQQREQFYVSKLRKQLSFIPDALISVSVKLNDDSHPAASTQSTRGLIANLGAVLGASRGNAETVASASVAVPRSYFVKIYQTRGQTLAEPTDGVLQPVIDAELDKIRHLVRTTLAIDSDDDVTVASYYDKQPAPPPAARTQTASASISMLMSNRIVQVAMGLTALLLLVVAPLALRSPRPHGATVSSRPIHAALLAPPASDFEDDELAADDYDEDSSEPPALMDESPDAMAHLVERWIDSE
jgi:flagellar biosynthesis/type III secretory pathway M-ring protein FliF/YscJ